jgi:hypothetical protein
VSYDAAQPTVTEIVSDLLMWRDHLVVIALVPRICPRCFGYDRHAIRRNKFVQHRASASWVLVFTGAELSIVHVYGDICQAVTEIAIAQNAAISVEEFQILNRTLDAAIAGALTEHARLTARDRSTLRGLSCPTCQSPLTQVVALRSSRDADEYHFGCDVCDQRWSRSTPPVHSNRVKRGETRPV